MYLHIGNGQSVKKEDIIGIFDLDTATVSKQTKKYISECEREGRVEYTDFDLPRSFLIYGKKGKIGVRLSRISSVGLRQRIDNELKGYFE